MRVTYGIFCSSRRFFLCEFSCRS